MNNKDGLLIGLFFAVLLIWSMNIINGEITGRTVQITKPTQNVNGFMYLAIIISAVLMFGIWAHFKKK